MPEAYPRTNPWPYVFLGLLLFGITLVPPTHWSRLLRNAHLSWVTNSSDIGVESQRNDPLKTQTRFQAHNSRVVVGYDPKAYSPMLDSDSESHKIAWVDNEPQAMDSLDSPTYAPSYGAARLVRQQTGFPEPDLDQSSVFDSSHASILAADAESLDGPLTKAQGETVPVAKETQTSPSNILVWTPPPSWQPSLIEPFTKRELQLAKQKAATQQMDQESIRIAATTKMVESSPNIEDWATLAVMSPVAKQERITRSDKPRQLSDIVPGMSLSVDPILLGEPESDGLPPDSIPLPEQENRQVELQAEPGPAENSPAVAKPSEPQIADIPTSDSNVDREWGESVRLKGLLQLGAETPRLEDWSKQLRLRVSQLHAEPMTGSKKQLTALATLRALAVYPVDPSRWELSTQETYWRIRHTVVRNADIWWMLSSLVPSQQQYQTQFANRLRTTTKSLIPRLTADATTAPWSEYLGLGKLLEATQDLTSSTGSTDLGVHAESTLSKLHNPHLDAKQKQFLSQNVFRKLDADLRRVIAASVSAQEISAVLGDYEDRSNDENTRLAIAKLQRFSAADDAVHRSDALKSIDAYYRNANFRISVSEQLVNQLVPAFHEYAEQVNDTILGAAVRGRNSTMTNLSVNFIPDPNMIRVGLFAKGQVNSNTASRKGPVVMYNQGTSKFASEKELTIGPQGIFSHQTETRAVTGNRVVGMRTDLDGFPFLGALIRSIARQQVTEQRPFLRAEILRRVQRSANRKIDVEVQRRLGNVERRVQSRIVEPLQQLNLDPRSMEMRTTSERVILRARLAGPLQLGAHAPRPQARADSQMSLQLHQTAANNWLNQLSLKGRRMTLGQLAKELSGQLGSKIEVQEKRQDTIVEFSKNNPAEFEFQDGQIKFTVHLAELNNGRDRWKNFSVCAHYRVDAQRLDVELIRDGGIKLITESLGFRDQIALRSIFTKVFDANPRLEMLRKAIEQQTSLRDLSITQLTIRDGWICLALGESRDQISRNSRTRVADAATSTTLR